MKPELAQRAADPNRVAHYYWPSEFPMGLCGHLSPFTTLAEAMRVLPGPICEMCARHAAAKPERPNPIHHQHGG